MAVALCAIALHAQAQFVVEMNDGQKFTWKSFTFNQQGSDDTWSIGQSAGSYNSAADLSLVKCISVTPLADQLASYKAPTYVDNYASQSSWANRSKWNLSNVHDPTVMRADDGYHYMYQTDASYGNAHEQGGHFHARRSKNLVDWEYLGGTMQGTPAWVKEKLNEFRSKQGLEPIENPRYGYWAPCARKVKDGLYRMYYCIVVDNYIKTGKANTTENFDGSWTERAFIGMMETADPASNKWEDKGFVICSSSDKGMNGWTRPNANDWNGYFYFNAIDPTLVITPEDEHWLIYGSWHSGFAAVQLNPETGKTLKELGDPWATSVSGLTANGYGKRIWTRTSGSRWQGSEAPEIVYHDGYYYLFMAYDALDVPYNTRVARSKTIDGTYSGEVLLTHPYKFSDSHGWVGISHCAVFDDGLGNCFYASQGRFPANVPGINVSNALMMGHVRSIRWTEDGWPVVMPERYGAVPQASIADDDLVGEWENITLTYQYNRQCTPVTITLNEDHTVTGSPFNALKWSWDAEKCILTIGSYKLYAQREVDWEAGSETSSTHTGRKATIVYAGYNSNRTTTYWGKKK